MCRGSREAFCTTAVESGLGADMGYSYQIFIADDEGGVQPVPQAKWCRIIDGREALRQHANRELKTLSVILEVDR